MSVYINTAVHGRTYVNVMLLKSMVLEYNAKYICVEVSENTSVLSIFMIYAFLCVFVLSLFICTTSNKLKSLYVKTCLAINPLLITAFAFVLAIYCMINTRILSLNFWQLPCQKDEKKCTNKRKIAARENDCVAK